MKAFSFIKQTLSCKLEMKTFSIKFKSYERFSINHVLYKRKSNLAEKCSYNKTKIKKN